MAKKFDSGRVGEIKVKALRIIAYGAMGLTALLMAFLPRIVSNYLYYVQNVISPNLSTAIIVYVYLCCIPFLLALITVASLCDVIAIGEPFSEQSLKLLSRIVWCCYIEAILNAAAILVFSIFFNIGIFISSIIIIGICGAVAIFATVLKELVKSAIRLREENDLTI